MIVRLVNNSVTVFQCLFFHLVFHRDIDIQKPLFLVVSLICLLVSNSFNRNLLIRY